jgi:hypothetical protein
MAIFKAQFSILQSISNDPMSQTFDELKIGDLNENWKLEIGNSIWSLS